MLLVEARDQVGGGVSSAPLTLPGFVHDLGSAVHPFGMASPGFRALELQRYGLSWVQPPTPLAHPLDGLTRVCNERIEMAECAFQWHDTVAKPSISQGETCAFHVNCIKSSSR